MSIQRIVIYLVESVIDPLNNQDQMFLALFLCQTPKIFFVRLVFPWSIPSPINSCSN